MSKELNIMFSDLTEDCQKRIFKRFGIESPEEMNWDVFPIASIPVDKCFEIKEMREERKDE